MQVHGGGGSTLKPLGQRLPPTLCWPTQATIWAMLMGDPLLPHWLMFKGLLCQCRVSIHTYTQTLDLSRLHGHICTAGAPYQPWY